MKRVHCKLAALIDAHNLKVSETGQGERLSQRSLAEKAGIAVTTVSRLYNNTARRFDGEVLEKLCEVFSCEVGELLQLVDVDKQ